MNTKVSQMKQNDWTERKMVGISVLEYGESSDCIRVNLDELNTAEKPNFFDAGTHYRVSNVENGRVVESWDFATLDTALDAAESKREELFN